MSAPLKIFIIYAREDESFKNGLLTAFIPLRRTGKIEVFHDALIKPGERWEEIILANLRNAQIILPLISSDFFGSDFIHEVEFKNAVERYGKGETVIMPIILKPCSWKYDPVIKTLQVLPKDGKPVATWQFHEEAWEQVLDAVFEEVENTEEKKIAKKRRDAAKPFFDLGIAATDLNEKIRLYSKAIEIDISFALAFHNRGWANRGLNKFAEAMKDFDQAILLDPNDGNSYHNRGYLKRLLNQHQDAVDDYNQAIELNPKDIAAYVNRGASLSYLGFNEKAKLDYQRALNLDPNHELAQNNLKLLEEKMRLKA